MAVNIFEGARRIAKLVAALWVIGYIVAAFDFFTSSVYVTYQIDDPEQVPMRAESDCNYSVDVTKRLDLTTSKGTDVSLTLCFKHRVFDNGAKLIPYLYDKDKVLWGGEEYSTEVSNYTQSVASNFKLSKSDEEWIDAQWWFQRLKELGLYVLIVIGGLLFLWTFTWVVGWIVRGFKGIPQGQDQRENKVDTSPSQ